jgi:hypothetical protein
VSVLVTPGALTIALSITTVMVSYILPVGTIGNATAKRSVGE